MILRNALIVCAAVAVWTCKASATETLHLPTHAATPESSAAESYKKLWQTRIRRYFRQRQADSIADAADRSGRLAGAAVAFSPLQADAQYSELLNSEFNYVTPENVAKWGELQPDNPNEWDFSKTDTLLFSADSSDQLFKGHALVWHVQLPSFVNEDLSPSELNSLIDTHIEAVLGRYAGRMYAWDVVNEAISDGDDFYRDTVFLRKLGTDYISNAFYKARSVDPYANLYYNDYGIERINSKSDKVYQLVRDLVDSGVPIDGVGFQMHLDAAFAPTVEQIVDNFERFTALGLTVNVSELDIRIEALPWDQATKLAIQGQIYHRVVDACMRVALCEGVTTWGFTDRYSWIDATFAPDDPLQFDENYHRKPAYYGMIDGFVGLDADPAGTLPNLIANSSFESGPEGWFAFGDGELKTIRSRRIRGRDHTNGNRLLLVRDRTANFHGPAYNLIGLISPNQVYDLTAQVSILGTRRADIAATLQLQCEGEAEQFVAVAATSVRKRRWSRIEGEFSTPDCDLEVANIYFEGPDARVKLVLDNPSVRPRELVIASNDELGPNLIANSGFELGTQDWFGFDSAVIDISTDAPFSGNAAGRASGRSAAFDGIATNLLEIVQEGIEYRLTSRVRLENIDLAEVKATLKAECPAGSQFISIAAAQASNSQWNLLTGDILIPECGATELTLYFEGPDPEVNLLLDAVTLQEILQTTGDNIISNPDFEENADHWFGFGAALVSTTNEAAFTGNQSLIASNRTQSFEGPAISLTNQLEAGASYQFTGHALLRGSANAEVRATLQLICSGTTESQFIGIASATANDTDWVELNGSVTIPDCTPDTANLYFEGPDGGIDILIDALSMRLESSPMANLVSNGDFESDTAPWFGFGGALLQISNTASSGLQSLLATNRTQNFEGPAIDLVTEFVSGDSYSLNAQVRIANAASAGVSATLQTVCEDGSESFNGIASVDAVDSAWSAISGTINVPACTATAQRLYFEGPNAGIDILIDEVEVVSQNP